jgi:nicotinate-nucleotide adenylyltransferase
MAKATSSLAVGVLGGTFDPIHYGHLRFADDARAALGLSEVRLIPAGRPPHRAPPVASAADRLAMTRLGAAEFSGIRVDDCELRREGPSYTVSTLTDLRAELGRTPIVLLLGLDAFVGLPSWHRWRELFDLAHLAVAARPGANEPDRLPPALAAEWSARSAGDAGQWRNAPAGRVLRVPIRPQAIAATDLRARLARGERPADLLPPAVLAYIEQHRLYQDHY